MTNNCDEEGECPIFQHLKHERYVLSAILSYLNETEGTSFLITNKTWTRRILPLFQLPDHLIPRADRRNNSNSHKHNDDGKKKSSHVRKLKQARHRFMVMPMQDPHVLLAKLNVKRLATRIRKRRGVNHSQSHLHTCACETVEKHGCDEGNKDCGLTNCFPLNMTTDEIAWHEWNQARMKFIEHSLSTNTSDDPLDVDDSSTSILKQYASQQQQWEAKLELLRFRTPPPTYKITTLHPSIPPPPKILPQTTLLTSYPRSGNTLLRNLLERITNIVTGSDTRPDRTLSKSLALDHDLVGEGIVQSTMTPIIKTHFPERRGYMAYNASRIILLVRNPYDAIDSYWNMCCTNTHTESVVEDIYDLYQEKFCNLAKEEICTWLRFVKFWLNQGNTTFRTPDEDHSNTLKSQPRNGTPDGQRPSLLVIRFEDLVLRTESVMEQVISFMLHGNSNMESELHPFWKWRIRHGLDLKHSDMSSFNNPPKSNDDQIPLDKSGKEEQPGSVNTLHLGSYKPRSEKKNSLTSIGKSIRKGRYSKDMLFHFEQMANKEEYQMEYLGGNNMKLNILELFEYGISTQNFPFCIGSKGKCWSLAQYTYRMGTPRGRDDDSVKVNIGRELRPKSSPFGRAMTQWRKSQTENDSIPFPTVKKS